MSLSELWSLYGQNYIDALLATWGMTLESFAIAMVLAVAVTVMRVSPLKPLRIFGDLYVQVFRNIPGIALLIIVVYALPPLKVVLPYRTCVIVATVFLGSAFGSENFMSGINTVGVGQVEAARSLGMSFSRILAKIVIPQALRSSVLPMTNLFIAVMLTTALGSQVPLKPQELTGVVSYPDLMQNARVLITNYDALVSVYLVIAVIYILINVAINKAAVYVSHKTGATIIR